MLLIQVFRNEIDVLLRQLNQNVTKHCSSDSNCFVSKFLLKICLQRWVSLILNYMPFKVLDSRLRILSIERIKGNMYFVGKAGFNVFEV